jgi:hypothetical protein
MNGTEGMPRGAAIVIDDCVFNLLGMFLLSALMPLSAGLFVCQGVFSIDMPDFHAR